MAESNFRALLIGNWDYAVAEGEPMLPLHGPRVDLERMKAALTHPAFGAFLPDNVDVFENLGSQGLSDELYAFADKSTPDDALLIYYSGHGERLGVEQKLGLVGVDVPHAKLQSRALDTTLISGWLKDARARTKVVILDCCYSGQYKGGAPALVDDEVLEMFGEGTVVLASGGNRVVPDAIDPDAPSPFTQALTEAMLDDALTGSNGWLTADDVYQALLRREPRLMPPPKRSMSAQGLFRLASRPVRPAAPTDVQGWVKVNVVRVSVTFADDRVVVAWDKDGDGRVSSDERDVAALETSRLAAVRRLCELADTVMRTQHKDPHWQERARHALDTAGANLFEAALPASLQAFVRSAPDRAGQVVRLDLRFEGSWSRLAELPWEYLSIPQGVSDGVRRAIVVSRTAKGPEATSKRPKTGDLLDIAVVNTLLPPQDRLAERVAKELVAMGGVRALATPTKHPAEWHQFLATMDQQPQYLVLCAPLVRERDGGRPVVKVGFGDGDLRGTGSLVDEIGRGGGLGAVILVTVATEQGRDAIRAAPMAAAELSVGLRVPVVFVCHSPGLEGYFRDDLDPEPRTFVGLLLTALACGKALDESLWYARERALRFIPGHMLPTFGAPGFFEGASSVARKRPRPKAEFGQGGRAVSKPGGAK